MAVDDSFKKPGAVPFKWEIKPGVPKTHQHQNHQQKRIPPPSPPRQPTRVQAYNHHRSSEMPSPKLKPPPAGSYCYVFSPVDSRTGSFRSSPRIRSDRWRFDLPLLSRPESVSTGCFLSPLLRRMPSKKKTRKPLIEPEPESDYISNLETLARWSFSSRKSLSPFRDSSSSSVSSYQSSPRPVADAEWAGFGLF